jgi:glycosyltransferase involved in cell wall biosynthesis
VKVSVLIITYNHERYIAQAVSSALDQRPAFDFEVVIGEDCSTDRTRAILVELQRRCPDRIRLLCRDSNVGMHQNLVQSLQACRGQYIALLEGDDYWSSPDKLQKQADFLDRHPECALCAHATTVVYEDGRQSRTHGAGRKPILTLGDLIEVSLQTCSVMFRNGLIDRFPEWFYTLEMADWPLHVLNAQHGDVGYMDEAMAVYRSHPSGAWSSRKASWWMHQRIRTLHVLNRHLDFKYDRRVQRALSTHYCELAYCYELEGDRAQARRWLLRSMAADPSNMAMLPRQLGVAVKLYAPMLYRPLRGAARYVLRR